MKIKVGPVQGKFQGKVILSDVEDVDFAQAAYSVGEDGVPVGAAVTLSRTGNLLLPASVQVNLDND